MSFSIPAIRFGWTAEQVKKIDQNPDIPATHPLKMHVTLSEADIQNPSNLAILIANHMKPGKENSRAFALTNTLALLKTPEAVHEFTQKLLLLIQDINKPRFTKDTYSQFTRHIYDNPVTGKPGIIANRSVRELSQQYANPMTSTRFPFHFDDQDIELFALIYGQNQDILSGGYPMVADILEAKPTLSSENQPDATTFNLCQYQASISAPVLPFSPQYAYALDYLDLKNDMPIVFLNNKNTEGVAHRGMPFETGENPKRQLKSYGVLDKYRPI